MGEVREMPEALHLTNDSQVGCGNLVIIHQLPYNELKHNKKNQLTLTLRNLHDASANVV